MSEIRWKQRFENFEKAFKLLKQAFEITGKDPENILLQEGFIQRFEYTFELGWKTIKDYLEYSRVKLDEITPRSVIKAAFEAKIIIDGQSWIDMLDDRNLMAHTYSEVAFTEAIGKIRSQYFKTLEETYLFFNDKKSS